MKYAEIDDAMHEYRTALKAMDEARSKLIGFGIEDLPGDVIAFPGDAPTSPAPVLPGGDSDTIRRKDVIDALNGGRPGTLAAWAKDAILALPSVAPKPAPGNLPGEPTEEMVEAGRCRDGDGDAYGAGMVREILRAALAAAPRVEVPEVTVEDCAVYVRAYEAAGGGEDFNRLAALRAVRVALNARMGAKS